MVWSVQLQAQSAFQNALTTNYFNSTILSKSAIRFNGTLPYDGVGKQFLINELSNTVVRAYSNTLTPTDYINPAYGNMSLGIVIPHKIFSAKLQTSTLGELDGTITNLIVRDRWRNTNFVNYYSHNNKSDKNQDGFKDLATKQRFLGMTNHKFRKKRYRGSFSLMHVNADEIGGQTGFDKSRDFLTTNFYGFGQKTDHTTLVANQTIGIGKKNHNRDKNSIVFHNEGHWHNQDAFYGTKELNTSEQTFNSYLGYRRKYLSSNLSVGVAYRYQNIEIDYSEQLEAIDYSINRWSIFANYNTFFTKNLNFKTFLRVDRENEKIELYPSVKLNLLLEPMNIYPRSNLTLFAGREKQLLLPTAEYQPFQNSSRTIDFPNLSDNYYERTSYFGASYQLNSFNFSIRNIFSNRLRVNISSTQFVWKTIAVEDYLMANITDGDVLNNGSLSFSRATEQVFNHIFEGNTNVYFNNYDFWFVFRYRFNDFSGENRPLLYPKHLFFTSINTNHLLDFMKISLGYYYQSSQLLNNNQDVSFGNHRWDLNTTVDLNRLFNKNPSNKFDLNIGINNLTNNFDSNSVTGAENPFGSEYDGSLTWKNTTGFNAYFGLKMSFN